MIGLRCKSVMWIYNPMLASQMGGAWEWLICSVRRIFSMFINDPTNTHSVQVNDEMLRTLISEVQCKMNSRLLTTSSVNPCNFKAIILSSLLQSSLDPAVPLGIPIDGINLRWNFLHIVNKSEWIWEQWIHSYVSFLQKRHTYIVSIRNLKLWNLVILTDHKLHRMHYPLDRIIEVYPDKVESFILIYDWV